MKSLIINETLYKDLVCGNAHKLCSLDRAQFLRRKSVHRVFYATRSQKSCDIIRDSHSA